ncbi:beta-mannosidase [Aspergillus luchuensis]|uniref:Beta-mannosidase n=1 Tax=Aspergillus kawachii TaxID=1069201 RepID=A0A146FIV1_ASPKA|nr:beta-mannosidase [Aspergillus luchuensis]
MAKIMSISYSTPSQRYSILDRVVGAFGGMGSERPRTLVIRPEPSPVGWDLGPVAAPSMMIVRDSIGNGVTGEIKIRKSRKQRGSSPFARESLSLTKLSLRRLRTEK